MWTKITIRKLHFHMINTQLAILLQDSKMLRKVLSSTTSQIWSGQAKQILTCPMDKWTKNYNVNNLQLWPLFFAKLKVRTCKIWSGQRNIFHTCRSGKVAKKVKVEACVTKHIIYYFKINVIEPLLITYCSWYNKRISHQSCWYHRR